MVQSVVRDRTDGTGVGSGPIGVLPDVAAPASREQLSAARRALRRQIVRLERDVAAQVAAGARTALPRVAAPDGRGARLLGLAELEEVRDRLVEARSTLHAREVQVERNREELEAASADPARHRGLRLTLGEVGEAGCGTFTVKPKLGILGRTLGWWRLKLSLGCPLATPAMCGILLPPPPQAPADRA